MIDTHAHLNDEKLLPNVKDILLECKNRGVTKIICASYDLPSSIIACDLAKMYPQVYATIGMHPHDSKHYDEEMRKRFVDLAKQRKVVAFGEIGLDYHYDLSPREMQKKVFAQQLLLADELQLPVVIHTRDAIGDTLQILDEYKKHINHGLVFHCFNASLQVANQMLNRGYKFSFGGSITFAKSKIIDLVKCLPTDSYFLETDCPYLTPHPFRGQTNYPQNVTLVAQFLSENLGKSISEIDEYTTKNAKEFFGIN